MPTNQESPATDPSWDAAATSLHIRAAKDGVNASRNWVVVRFTPLMQAQASYRLSGPLKRLYDPDDLVNEVWIAVLPKLANLEARDGRWTPVLLRFLSTTLLHKVNHLLEKQLTGRLGERSLGPRDGSQLEPEQALEAQITGPSSVIARDEICQRIHSCIDRLEPAEREVIVLRGIEQLSNQTVAELLGENHSTISMRYARALEKLRRAMPDSILTELVD